MCRSIMLHNFEPPVTDEEIYAAALQFVRKISAINAPSGEREVLDSAVDEVHAAARRFLDQLPSREPKRNREEMAARARERAARRFAPA
ncbi:MAG: DUF2277 domain-containing protein [Acidobacteriota bacterium]